MPRVSRPRGNSPKTGAALAVEPRCAKCIRYIGWRVPDQQRALKGKYEVAHQRARLRLVGVIAGCKPLFDAPGKRLDR